MLNCGYLSWGGVACTEMFGAHWKQCSSSSDAYLYTLILHLGNESGMAKGGCMLALGVSLCSSFRNPKG